MMQNENPPSPLVDSASGTSGLLKARTGTAWPPKQLRVYHVPPMGACALPPGSQDP